MDEVLTYPVYKGTGAKRARLGDLAFVVMSTRADAERILAGVGSVRVAGFDVEVAPFCAGLNRRFQ